MCWHFVVFNTNGDKCLYNYSLLLAQSYGKTERKKIMTSFLNATVTRTRVFFAPMLILLICSHAIGATWSIKTQSEWEAAKANATGLKLAEGYAKPNAATATFQSVVKSLPKKTRLKKITFKQSTVWDNWEQIDDVTPEGLGNAHVFLPVGPGDYYVLAEKAIKIDYPKGMTADERRAYKKKNFKRSEADQGYHAWHSKDLKKWKYCGKVCNSKWVTTAEYANGKFYIYYDKPNDEEPHLVIDEDLKDGVVGKEMGMVFNDPSHGSDIAIFRDEDGSFHIIYEDWSPINAQTHSWDSPLAGHTSSPDGITGFKPHEHPYPIDHRTKPTGKVGTYRQGRQKYNIHEPEQNAYGDYTMIKVGSQYYLFCDFDSAEPEKKMRIGRFTSDDLYKEFTWAGEIGEGFHPDPSVGFAEGQFYIIMQQKTDFVSPGPWVDGVEVRVGVDEDGDGQTDKWTDWQRIKESYSQKPGFARIVDVKPASLDLSSLPAGKGVQFEFKTKQLATNKVQPIIASIEIE